MDREENVIKPDVKPGEEGLERRAKIDRPIDCQQKFRKSAVNRKI